MAALLGMSWCYFVWDNVSPWHFSDTMRCWTVMMKLCGAVCDSTFSRVLKNDTELLADPKLTPIGIEQAQLIKQGWATEAKFGLPQPHRRYCSPLTRALKTAETIFTSLYESYPNPILIKEVNGWIRNAPRLLTSVVKNCREMHGSHTCDKRNTRSYLVSEFPGFDIEPSFTEEDLLWTPTRETRQEVSARAKTMIEGVFRDCKPDTCTFCYQRIISILHKPYFSYFNYGPQWIHRWVSPCHWSWFVSSTNRR